MKKNTFELLPFCDFADVLDGNLVVTAGIGPGGNAILLSVDPNDERVPFEQDGCSGWAKSTSSGNKQPYPGRIIQGRHGATYAQDFVDIMPGAFHIQPLHGDRTLVVSLFLLEEDGQVAPNASVYNRTGVLVRRMFFGDGIADVQVGNHGRVWVSFFDEGVYRRKRSPALSGAMGLLALKSTGELEWYFHRPYGFGPISDCYAMNVDRDNTWVCYYTGFPIVKIDPDFNTTGWCNEFRGARAIAVDEPRILLWGGYSDNITRCIVQTIRGETLINPVNLELSLSNADITQARRVIGRGSVLHFFCGTCWYKFDLKELPVG
jgi:hypothetical protein